MGYADAILGCDVKVPTVDGDVTLNIPAGTQPETVPRARAADPPASWRRRCHSRARGRPVRRLEILRVLRPPPRSGGWARRLRVPCRARSALGCDIACGGGADADVGVCGDVLVMMVALLLLHARKPRHRRQRWRQRQRGSSPLPHPAIISEREITHWNIPPPQPSSHSHGARRTAGTAAGADARSVGRRGEGAGAEAGGEGCAAAGGQRAG